MKITAGFLTLVIFIIHVSFLKADEIDNGNDRFAIDSLYEHFESRFSPKDLLHMTQKRAMYISDAFKRSDKEGIKAIDEFNFPFTRWNHLDGFHPQFGIHNTEKGWVEAHANPALHKIRYIENLAWKYKDHLGQLTEVEGFGRVKETPEGVWVWRFSTFIKSKTKIATPFYIMSLYVGIPGTDYHVVGHMPYRGYSAREMDKTKEYLNKMVMHWTIMEK